MAEKPITFLNDTERIAGVIHSPLEQHFGSTSLIIFLHGFAGYRIGPHQYFVKLSRQLTQVGYTCIRFDFRGRGFSDGRREDTSYKTMVSDLDTVLKEADKRFSPKQIILIGICSGTKAALYYLKNKENNVCALIGLSSPQLWNSESISKATAQTQNILREYTHKAMNIDTWRRLLRGNINIEMVSSIINKHLKVTCQTIAKRYKGYFSKNNKHVKDNQSATDFFDFHGKILLIHGENDPETPYAMEQITTLLLRNKLYFEKHIIRGANHSFYSLTWEKEISNIIQNWLSSNYPPQ